MLDIDGSVLEGGGQILRMSIAFSAIFSVPVRITKIRLGRSKPGLAPQHMKGIQLVGEMCRAKLKGVDIGSTEIEFVPDRLRGGHYVADPKTAGSISLLLQVSLPCALMADGAVTLDLKGGTNADMAPQVDYLTEVFRPFLEGFGGTFDFELHRRGYYPRGGGHVTATVTPVSRLRAVTATDRGSVTGVHGWSFVAGTLPIKLAHQMADGAKQELAPVARDVKIECYKETREMAPDNCSGIILVCETSTGCVLGSDGLGKRDTFPIQAGKSAGATLRKEIEGGACVDSHTQDQMIIFMALAGGKSSVRVGEITLHTRTAIYIAETIAKIKFNIIPDGATSIIECTGLGYENKYLPPRLWVSGKCFKEGSSQWIQLGRREKRLELLRKAESPPSS